MHRVVIVAFLLAFSSNGWAAVSTVRINAADEDPSGAFTITDRDSVGIGTDNQITINIDDCETFTSDATYGLKLTFDVDPAPDGGDFKVELGDSSCDQTSTDDGCTTLSISETTMSTTVTRYAFTVKWSDLIKVDCSSGTDKTRVLLIIANDSSLGSDDTKPELAFKVVLDLSRPAAPANVVVSGGDANLNVGWDAVDNAEKYKIYYSESPFDFDTRKNVFSSGELTGTGAKVTDNVENDKSYYVSVVSIDSNGNESALSTQSQGTAVPTIGFFEHYVNTAGDNATDGGFCFVATAAFGSYENATVTSLRLFRDQVLLTSKTGQRVVDGYYGYGPIWAEAIADNGVARRVASGVLWPLAKASRLWLTAVAWQRAVLLLFLGAALLALARRRRRYSAADEAN